MAPMKVFNVRLPRELWIFLKSKAAHEERSMANIVLECLHKIKPKKVKKKK
jgi:hypothetical protein